MVEPAHIAPVHPSASPQFMTAHQYARRSMAPNVVGAEGNTPAPVVNPHMQGTNMSAQINWRSSDVHRQGGLSGFGRMNRGTLVETGF